MVALRAASELRFAGDYRVISTASGSNSGKCVQADLAAGAEGRNPVTLSRLVPIIESNY